MASRLPAVPRLVFTVIEPISLLCGSLPAIVAPDWFVKEQVASASAASILVSENSRVVAQQLGNAYGLLFLVGVAVLYTSTELRVVRNYLVALLLADVGHIGLTMCMLGPARSLSPGAWNAMTWGNIGVTASLALTRIAYLLGLFGRDLPMPTTLADKSK